MVAWRGCRARWGWACPIACRAARLTPAQTILRSSSGFARSRRGGKAVASALVMAAVAAPILAGAATHGGAVPGGTVIHVTTLADAGPGSLREAFSAKGPKVIVFDVGGVIHLASDIKLATDHTTIAGQTAPAPITLTGGSFRLRASDVIM